MTTIKTLLATAGLGLGSALLAVSCGGGASAADICQKACDCLTCSGGDQDECVQQIEQIERAADDAGCGSDMQAYLDCVDANMQCQDGELSFDGCESETSAVSRCMGESQGGTSNSTGPGQSTPPGWTCPAGFYGDGDCDCGCGAPDIDCPSSSIDACEFCFCEEGVCDETSPHICVNFD